ncbi:Abscisic acid receptor PYL5 [Spatholobus suberectus]|nr:Abscisic acid receptor PYL5 [Spatholobus suberectus]
MHQLERDGRKREMHRAPQHLDNECHVIGFSKVDNDYYFSNYHSVTILRPRSVIDHCASTIFVESYVVDVPPGNTTKCKQKDGEDDEQT